MINSIVSPATIEADLGFRPASSPLKNGFVGDLVQPVAAAQIGRPHAVADIARYMKFANRTLTSGLQSRSRAILQNVRCHRH
jgi:hypothetical protein